MAKKNSYQGTVKTVGLERDDKEFSKFNLTIGIKVKADKYTYAEGEKLLRALTSRLVGKNVEVTMVAVPCPICGEEFNSEAGMKQHYRKQHGEAPKPKRKRKAK